MNQNTNKTPLIAGLILIIAALIAVIALLLTRKPVTNNYNFSDTSAAVLNEPAASKPAAAVPAQTVPAQPASQVPAQQPQAPATPANSNKISKASWGISFQKLSNWSVVENDNNKIILTEPIDGDKITLSYSTGESVTDDGGAGPIGPVTYRFSTGSQQWMKTTGEDLVPKAATPALMVGGRPVFSGTTRWKTYIIPISTSRFVTLNITGSGNTQPLESLVASLELN